MVTFLAFLPYELIKSAAAQLKEHIQEEAVDFVNKVDKNYIGSFHTDRLPGSGVGMRLVWKEARFPPQILSVYYHVINQDPRTNNFLEGWHRRFSTIVDVHHPDIYKFRSKLTGEQAHTEMSRREILHGEDPNPPPPPSPPKKGCTSM